MLAVDIVAFFGFGRVCVCVHYIVRSLCSCEFRNAKKKKKSDKRAEGKDARQGSIMLAVKFSFGVTIYAMYVHCMEQIDSSYEGLVSNLNRFKQKRKELGETLMQEGMRPNLDEEAFRAKFREVEDAENNFYSTELQILGKSVMNRAYSSKEWVNLVLEVQRFREEIRYRRRLFFHIRLSEKEDWRRLKYQTSVIRAAQVEEERAEEKMRAVEARFRSQMLKAKERSERARKKSVISNQMDNHGINREHAVA